MRGVADGPTLPAVNRRALLTSAGAALAGAGCAPVPSGQEERHDAVFVSLGTRRVVAMVDQVGNRVLGETSLGPLGWEGAAGNLVVGPGGEVAILPLSDHSTTLGILRPTPPATSGVHGPGAPAMTLAALPLAGEVPARSGASGPEADMLPMAVADRRGRAYVVVAHRWYRIPTRIAVVDLSTARMLRRLEIAPPGEHVTALAAAPDGGRLYVATWRPSEAAQDEHSPPRTGAGRILVLDSESGGLVARRELGEGEMATQLVAAAPSAGAASQLAMGSAEAGVLYAAVQGRNPSGADGDWGTVFGKSRLLALDSAQLYELDVWSLARPTSHMVLHPHGPRMYLLNGTVWPSPLSLESVALDTGAVRQHLSVPDGVRGLALGRNGSLYVLDAHGHRLWRYDTLTQRLVGTVTLDAAPVAVGA